tara:strand:+ start:5767 stop:6186 length:420 start_codon:yes stop_codon:yes gene_type:complete
MGLDQYGLARKGEPRKVPQTWTTTDADGNEKEVVEYYDEWEDSMELAYWRKHPNLQGWMEELWREKGNDGEFNCVDLELTLGDLEALEASIDGADLPKTVGFFFGQDSDDHYLEQDREFIREARAAIKDGYTVVYYSWW